MEVKVKKEFVLTLTEREMELLVVSLQELMDRKTVVSKVKEMYEELKAEVYV